MQAQELIRWGLIIGIPLFILILYKFILRVFFGVVIVPEDRIGLVTKKFVLLISGLLGLKLLGEIARKKDLEQANKKQAHFHHSSFLKKSGFGNRLFYSFTCNNKYLILISEDVVLQLN